MRITTTNGIQGHQTAQTMEIVRGTMVRLSASGTQFTEIASNFDGYIESTVIAANGTTVAGIAILGITVNGMTVGLTY